MVHKELAEFTKNADSMIGLIGEKIASLQKSAEPDFYDSMNELPGQAREAVHWLTEHGLIQRNDAHEGCITEREAGFYMAVYRMLYCLYGIKQVRKGNKKWM